MGLKGKGHVENQEKQSLHSLFSFLKKKDCSAQKSGPLEVIVVYLCSAHLREQTEGTYTEEF